MILESIKYNENSNRPNAWELEEFDLDNINLVVGKNATGKTRTLNIIGALSNLVSGTQELIYSSGNYETVFKNGESTIKYYLQYEKSLVVREELDIDGEILLKRGAKGEGEIYYSQTKQKMSFQAPENKLACVARRDSIQHPFFEKLYQWGKNLRHYHFSTPLGRDILTSINKAKENQNVIEEKDEVNIKDENKVAIFLHKGYRKYGKPFFDSIKHDMGSIGYNIDDISIEPIEGLRVGGVPLQPNLFECIFIKESDLSHKVRQLEISQGMFRALSLIIQLNYTEFNKIPGAIIVDDIGEGLDYDRSMSLIKLLIDKCSKSKLQLIMSTNDRFVMNNVPLEYWSVIQRSGGKCKIYNYKNSKEVFDEFKFTGLNNFDFLSTEFYAKGFNKS